MTRKNPILAFIEAALDEPGPTQEFQEKLQCVLRHIRHKDRLQTVPEDS